VKKNFGKATAVLALVITINVLMSERALRETYLPGFKAAVEHGGVYSVAGAYNKFRGEWCT